MGQDSKPSRKVKPRSAKERGRDPEPGGATDPAQGEAQTKKPPGVREGEQRGKLAVRGRNGQRPKRAER